jgi:hypothetical protein
MKRRLIWISAATLAVLCASLLCCAIIYKTSVAGVVVIAAAVKLGQSDDCSFAQGVQAWETDRLITDMQVRSSPPQQQRTGYYGDTLKAVDGISGSRAVEFEGRLQLWDTPFGRFWFYQTDAFHMDSKSVKWAVLMLRSGLFSKFETRPRDVVIIDSRGDFSSILASILARRALSAGAEKVFMIIPWLNPREDYGREVALARSRNFQKDIQDGKLVVIEPFLEDVTINSLVRTHGLQKIDLIYRLSEPELSGSRDTLEAFSLAVAEWKPRVAMYLGDDPKYWSAVKAMTEQRYAVSYGPCVMREAHPSRTKLDDDSLVGMTFFSGGKFIKPEHDKRQILPLTAYFEPPGSK